MPRYVPVSTNAAPIFAAPDSIFHVGFWQSNFYIEYNDIDNNPPNAPVLTSPNGGENISSRYFTVTWTEASPTDPDGIGGACNGGDCVCYSVEYTTDNGLNWFYAFNNSGLPILCIAQGTTSVVWDLGAIPDTTNARIRLCSHDTYGCNNSTTCTVGGIFTITGGSCF